MANMVIRGTTPTFVFTFKEIDVSDITAAYLTITGKGAIEKDLSQATVGDDTIAWTLTQAETLAMTDRVTTVQLNWKTSDGTRGASLPTQVQLANNAKDEVI